MNQKDFNQKLRALMAEQIHVKDPTRTMKIVTGSTGVEAFHKAMQVEIYRPIIENWDDAESLLQMLESKDPESVDLAIAIIEEKIKEI